jgi:hypothetical protein
LLIRTIDRFGEFKLKKNYTQMKTIFLAITILPFNVRCSNPQNEQKYEDLGAGTSKMQYGPCENYSGSTDPEILLSANTTTSATSDKSEIANEDLLEALNEIIDENDYSRANETDQDAKFLRDIVYFVENDDINDLKDMNSSNPKVDDVFEYDLTDPKSPFHFELTKTPN